MVEHRCRLSLPKNDFLKLSDSIDLLRFARLFDSVRLPHHRHHPSATTHNIRFFTTELHHGNPHDGNGDKCRSHDQVWTAEDVTFNGNNLWCPGTQPIDASFSTNEENLSRDDSRVRSVRHTSRTGGEHVQR